MPESLLASLSSISRATLQQSGKCRCSCRLSHVDLFAMKTHVAGRLYAVERGRHRGSRPCRAIAGDGRPGAYWALRARLV